MPDEILRNNTIVISNAVQLIALVCMEVSGNDISNRINGSPITLDTLNLAATAIIRNELENKNAITI
jgi:hypothetical protein